MDRWTWLMQSVSEGKLRVDPQVVRQLEEQRRLEAVATQIRDLRRSKGYSQAELAALVGSNQPSLSRFESGKINAGYAYVKRLLDALN
ncbi:MAG: helix-turn-helix transcriptional regulator [Spirochaetales bacterium]